MGYNDRNSQGRQPNRNAARPPRQVTARPLPANYVDEAERVIRSLYDERNKISTNKIRNLLSLVSEIYNRENLRTADTISEESASGLIALRIRMVYEAGRDDAVKLFLERAQLLEYIKGLGDSRSSKYVQSSIPADIYAQAKAALTAGRWVYFSGMPCQVAGLKNYLSREYETLITQDTACHSVPSPMIWKDYRSALETQNGSKLKSFSFRKKATGWENYHIHAAFENGREFLQLAAKNPYQRGFIKGLYSRGSCFDCKFKGIERCSDITLADYWGVKGIQPEAYHPQGTSLVLLHSEKGRALLERCKDRLQTCPAAEGALTWNPAMLRPIQKPARYDEFWAGYEQKPFAELVSACCEPTKEEAAKERWNRSLLARVIRRLTR